MVIDAGGPEIAAPYYANHPRARRLVGTKLLVEFDWAERAAETLTVFAEQDGTVEMLESEAESVLRAGWERVDGGDRPG